MTRRIVTPFAEDRFVVASDETGFEYEISVEVPSRYEIKPDTRFPVVICLDGLWTYGPVRDAFRILPLDRELAESVVVGVGHASTDLKEVLQLRAVDYTPTPYQPPPQIGVRLPASEVGRADRFRRFLVDTLLPTIDDRYRTSDRRTLVGHSFSGLFGVDMLLTEPAAFERWVLASPSVWWDDYVMFDREAAHAAATDDLAGSVFMSVGGDESPSEFGRHQAFHDQLAGRRYPSLDLHWALLPGETHQSVIATAIIRGLRTLHHAT